MRAVARKRPPWDRPRRPGEPPLWSPPIRPRALTVLCATACAAACLSAAASAAPGGRQDALSLPGRVLAVGDFETGSLNQWSVAAAVRSSSVRVVRAPVRQGRYAARFEVHKGDNPIGFGDRAQIQIDTHEHEGETRWYSWSTRLSPSFPRTSAWQVLAQWHSQKDGPPPVGLYGEGDDFVLQANRTTRAGRLIDVVDVWRGPLLRGQWRDFKVHVHWSGSDANGWIELWVDGVRQELDDGTLRRRVRTMFPGVNNYFTMGYYRRSGISRPGVVYHDAFRMSA